MKHSSFFLKQHNDVGLLASFGGQPLFFLLGYTLGIPTGMGGEPALLGARSKWHTGGPARLGLL